MKKERILLLLATWVAVLPYLGFPYEWKNILFTLTGFGLAYLSYLLYRETKALQTKEKNVFENFSENSDFMKEDKKDEPAQAENLI
jgi:hypothetical protein